MGGGNVDGGGSADGCGEGVLMTPAAVVVW